jgi:hypothetical protein
VAGSTPGELRKGALDPKPPTDPRYDLPVLAVGAGTVSLALGPDLARRPHHRGRLGSAIDGFAFPSDPRTAFGLPFREVSYASELGPTRPGSSAAARDLGAVRARLQRPRREALRLLRVVADEGFPALVLSTVTILGPAETSFALDQGATGVVLIGYSMGGLWPSASCTSRSWRPRFAG